MGKGDVIKATDRRQAQGRTTGFFTIQILSGLS